MILREYQFGERNVSRGGDRMKGTILLVRGNERKPGLGRAAR